MSLSALLMWLLIALGLYTPPCEGISVDDIQVCDTAVAQPRPMQATNDISNGI